MLCDVCRKCLEGISDPSITPRLGRFAHHTTQESANSRFDLQQYVFGHHRTSCSLQRSIDAGCLLCERHIATIRASTGRTTDETSYFSTFRITFDNDVLQVHMTCCGTEPIGRLVPVGVAAYDDGVTSELDNTTSGPRAWACAKHWIENCTMYHSDCKTHHDPTFLPTRLLKLDGSRKPPTWHLVNCDDCPRGSQYNTLSYIWGKRPLNSRTRLLHSTLESLQEEKSIETLSKTFQDAMLVSLRLNVHYIWIDSLCIIQDSAADWKAESQMMDRVYRNSFLTISAVSGTDDTSGIFYDRDVERVAPTTVQLPLASDGTRRPFRHSYEYARSWAFGWRRDSVSTKRGWCVQERLLPPRVLHFGASQLYWECRQQTACEVAPGSPFKKVDGNVPQRRRLWKRLLGAPTPPEPEGVYEQIFFDWYVALMIYTRADLTYPSDKLPALSGLANDMKRALCELRPDDPHRYIAGLWEEDLRTGLCWNSNASSFHTRPATYRAPSWSWASIDGLTGHVNCLNAGGLTWFVDKDECVASAQTTSAHEMGVVLDARLELTGPFVIISMGCEQAGQQEAQISNTINPVTFARYDLPCPARTRVLNGLPLEHTVRFDIDADQAAEVYCVLMQVDKTAVSKGDYWSIFGILFLDAEAEGLFRRVGYTFIHFETQIDALEFAADWQKRKIVVI